MLAKSVKIRRGTICGLGPDLSDGILGGFDLVLNIFMLLNFEANLSVLISVLVMLTVPHDFWAQLRRNYV